MTPKVKQRIEQIWRGEVPEGYKKTALGIVPANWIETTLGEIYTERNEPGNDALPLLMVSIYSGVSDGEVAEEDLPKKVKRIEDKSQYKHTMPGDLVFNMMRAWQGAIGSVRTEGMVSPAYIVAKPNDMVDPIFMDYYMKMPRMINLIHRQSYGVTDFRLRLYWDSFSPIPCVLPPVEEQKHIADILSAQDNLIALQQKKIAELQQLRKSYLKKLFPTDGCKEPELRFNGFTDAWEKRKVSSMITDIADGPFGSNLKTEHYTEEREARIIQLSNLSDYGWQEENIKYTTFEHAKEIKRCIVNEGELVMGKMMPAGMTIMRPNTEKMYVLSSDCVRIKLDNAIATDMFFLYTTKSDVFLDQVKNDSQGSTRIRTSISKIREMDIDIPAVAEQEKIGEYFAKIDHLITLHQRKADHTLTKKDVLMQLLMTGQLQVSV